MSSSDDKTLKARWEDSHFLVRGLVVGLLVAGPGFFVLWWSSTLPPGVDATFWSQIGTTLINLGLVGILYESFLKRALIHDISKSLKVNNDLVSTGLIRTTFEPETIAMRDLFATAHTVHIFPGNPLTWHDRNMGWLTDLARTRRVHVKMYLPEPMRYSDARQKSVENRAHETWEFCQKKFGEVHDAWRENRLDETGSSLETFTYNGYPHGGFVVADRAAVVYVHDQRGKGSVQNTLALIYEGESALRTIQWLMGVIERLDKAAVDGTPPEGRSREQILPLVGEADDREALGSSMRGDVDVP